MSSVGGASANTCSDEIWLLPRIRWGLVHSLDLTFNLSLIPGPAL